MDNKVCIIILNYNSWKETIEEAKHCNVFFRIPYMDICIVDNASCDESSDNLKKASHELGFVYLESTENKGYAAGNNIGLRYAYNKGYEYAWILNNDILFQDKDTLKKLVDVMKMDDSVAVVNPDVYNKDGYLLNRDSKKPTIFDYTLGILNYRKAGRKVIDLGGFGYVYRPQGCCMLVDLEKMNEVDYMDEKTFLYVEEPILAERLLKKRYRCACCLTTSIIHNHSQIVRNTFDAGRVRELKNESFGYYLKEYRKYGCIKIFICKMFNSIKMIILKN